MTHAQRALARLKEISPLLDITLFEIEDFIDLLDAIEQTREERKVPQPLTNNELQGLGWGYIGAGALKEDGLGIYRIKDIKEAGQ